ncbi:MAG: hypothetical protein ACLRXC_12205 [[Clostridium] leptum]
MGIRQYIRVFFGTELEWYYSFHNTILLSVPILLMTILLCTMSGYGLSKFRFPGRKALLISYIIILLLPVQVTLVPFFIFFNTMHLMESRFPLIAFCSFSPFGAFLMYQFIRSIPDDSTKRGAAEGASEWRSSGGLCFAGHAGYCGADDPDADRLFQMIEQPSCCCGKKLVSYVHYAQISVTAEYFRSFCAGRCLCHSGFPRLSAATGLPDRRISTAPGRIK